MQLYFLPGLGFDCRIFDEIEIENATKNYLNWEEPFSNETFSRYAKRIAKKITLTPSKTILIGHSLGGMLAQEIAQIQSVDAIILISSIRSRKELPLQFKIIQPLRLQYLFSKKLTLKTVKYWGKSHDYPAGEAQELFKSMVNLQSDIYLKWALISLSTWQTPTLPTSTLLHQIHGKKDKTFPISLLQQPDLIVENGGHFMIFNQAKIIQEEINAFLTKLKD